MAKEFEWDNINDDEYEYVNFDMLNPTNELKFVEFVKKEEKDTKFGKKTEYRWNVIDLQSKKELVLTVISGRLLRALKQHMPINGKSLRITKVFDINPMNNTFTVDKITKQSELKTK